MDSVKNSNEANAKAVKSRFPCKKIRAGKYNYRGYIIICVGYYEPDKRVCWEGCDPITGAAEFLGYSKKDIKISIDHDLSKNGKER